MNRPIRGGVDEPTPGSTGFLPAGFARGAAVLLGGRVGFHALGLVTGVLLARGLGPDGRGAFFAVLMWPTLLGWLATMGITKATTYFRAKNPEYERDLAATGLWVSLLAGGGLTVLAQLLLPRMLQGYPDWVLGLGRLTLLLIPLMAFSDILMGMFDGARQFRLVTTFRLGLPLLQVLGLTVLFAWGRLTVSSAVWLYGMGVVATVGLQYLVVAGRSGWNVRPPERLVRETGRYALRFTPVLVADLALSFLDQIFLLPLLSPGQMGLYVVATRAAILAEVPVAVSQLVFAYVPAMSPDQGIRLAQRATTIVVIITGVLGGALLLAARPLIFLLYGEAFVGAVWPFQVVLLGSFAIGVRKILADALNGLGKPHHSSAGQVIALVTMAVLLWTLVPLGGIVGAVWAVVVAQWINLAVTGGLFWLERRRAMSAGPVTGPTI